MAFLFVSGVGGVIRASGHLENIPMGTPSALAFGFQFGLSLPITKNENARQGNASGKQIANTN